MSDAPTSDDLSPNLPLSDRDLNPSLDEEQSKRSDQSGDDRNESTPKSE